MAGAIFFVTVPDTIITSLCRGLGQGTMPKRSRSWLLMKVPIISMAQQASPKVMGQSELLRLTASTASTPVCSTPGMTTR